MDAEQRTALDAAHAAMEAAPEDVAARMRFYERLAGAELFLLLDAEPAEGATTLSPMILPTGEGDVALVFDTEERMAGFVDAPTPFAALSGRRLAALLAQRDITLGLNLGVAPSAILLPPEALGWMGEVLGAEISEESLVPERIGRPKVIEARVIALDERLAGLAGIVGGAWLANAVYPGGAEAPVLALTDVPEGARGAVAEALAETHRLSGPDTAVLDIVFLDAQSPVLAAFRRHGIGFELPEPQPEPEMKPIPGAAPGMDPSKPPRLR
ncbi:SseB family protein [Paroceanicella profunda]|uniref:SseB family protein n=1 Tax=Paroceanicella profunda TaxID=2579971 RepID=A0A5B8FQA5_9RHOB|nr:SseB family protein [Paroceanicella profunda]QDL90786.1 SseB family protein [Paroceanicella profunda]